MSTALDATMSGPVQHGTVLTATRFACYAMLDEESDPSVIAIVAPGAVRLPISLYVARLPAVAQGDPFTIGEGSVTAAGHAWRAARWWDPRPRVDANALIALGWRLDELVRSEPSERFGIELDRAHFAVSELARGNPEPACWILGFGPGLTPAGDDVIAGAFAALALTNRLPETAVDDITSAARSRTTALSTALIVAASRGQVVPQAARLLHSLIGDDDSDTIGSVARGLFAVGATSGHDLALGLATALTATARVHAMEAK